MPNDRFLVPQYEGVWHTPSRRRPSPKDVNKPKPKEKPRDPKEFGIITPYERQHLWTFIRSHQLW